MKTGSALGLAAMLLFLATATGARAGGSLRSAPGIASPEIHQTWPEARLRDWSFRLSPDKTCFTVVTTYSNELIADRQNPQAQDDFFFRFPDVKYSPKSGAFLWKNPKGGAPLLVAWRRPSGGQTELRKGAIVLIFKIGGKLAAGIQFAPPGKSFTTSLAEISRGSRWSLQSLIER